MTWIFTSAKIATGASKSQRLGIAGALIGGAGGAAAGGLIGSNFHARAGEGAPQPVEAGYMANAYVRMRHPDYDALRGMLDAVGQMLHVYAS